MDANSFLMGGSSGAPTAKFPTPGTVIGGRITEPPKLEQQRDIKSGEKKFWKDGDPMMQVVVTVQTDQRDPAIEDDDGKRRLFIKGQMKNAVSDAVRATGAPGLEVGGTLHVRFTHELPASGPGMSPPKQYEARYVGAAADGASRARRHQHPVGHRRPGTGRRARPAVRGARPGRAAAGRRAPLLVTRPQAPSAAARPAPRRQTGQPTAERSHTA